MMVRIPAFCCSKAPYWNLHYLLKCCNTSNKIATALFHCPINRHSPFLLKNTAKKRQEHNARPR